MSYLFDSSEDDMDSNLHLAEKLMLNTAHIAADESMDWCDTRPKTTPNCGTSSLSSKESQRQDGPSCSTAGLFQFGAHKKRQNVDKSSKQSKHPKRTCLTDEIKQQNNGQVNDLIPIVSGASILNGHVFSKKDDKTLKNPRIIKKHSLYSTSDDDSCTLPITGALKGGRQTPEKLVGKKTARRRVEKSLDSNETGDSRWNGRFRSNALIFTSSDDDSSSDFQRARPRKTNQSKACANPVFPAKKSSRPDQKSITEGFVTFTKQVLGLPSTSTQNAGRNPEDTNGKPSTSRGAVNEGASCSGLYQRARKPSSQVLRRHSSRLSKKSDATSSNPGLFSSISQNSERMDLDLNERAGTLPRSKERQDWRRGTREAGLRKQPKRYADYYVADNDSEVEFFTANSYSDAESSSAYGSNQGAGFYTERPNDSLRSPSPIHPPASRKKKPVPVRIESSEDEISVVYSTNAPERRSDSHSKRIDVKPGKRRNVLRTPVRQPVSLSPVPNLVSSSPDPVEQVRQVEEDERLARQLQAQFDSERDPPFIFPSSSHQPRPTPHMPIIPRLSFPPVSVSDSSTSDDDIDVQSIRRGDSMRRWGEDLDDLPPYLRAVAARTRRQRSRRGGPPRSRPPPAHQRHHNLPNYLIDLFNMDPNAPNVFSHLFERPMDNYEALLNLEDHSRGLTKTDIGRLPTRTYAVPSGSALPAAEPLHRRAELNKECQVCLMDYADGDVLRILPCFHEFHTPCIDPWLKTNRTCPVCRVVVNLDESIDVE